MFGDSLSKEYSVEFPHLDAVNWIEILDKERHEDFDVGSFRVFPDFRATGHKYNWSFPGATTDDMLDNLTGDGFFQEIAQDEIKDHLRKEVDRVVIFLGGNDMDNRYRSLYANEDPTPIMNRVYENIESILNLVKRRNPDLEIVIANVPHIGATPKTKKEHGTDPVRVGHVTTAIRDLNERLAQLARSEGVGYADIFAITMDLLEEKPFCISGVRFQDDSDADADKLFLWLAGTLADEFHPNTNAQAVVANAIIKAFNAQYNAEITPLGGTEILSELLNIEPDRAFEEWISCYEPGALNGPWDDLDGDGRDNFSEFVFDTHPSLPDLAPIHCPQPYQIDYRPRRRASPHFTLRLETSTDLRNWSTSSTADVTEQPFGSYRWSANDTLPGELFVRFVVEKP